MDYWLLLYLDYPDSRQIMTNNISEVGLQSKCTYPANGIHGHMVKPAN
jgi:hypothetical protein